MPAAGHPVPQEVKHQASLQSAHQEVVTLNVYFELGEDLERLPTADNAHDLEDNDYSKGHPVNLIHIKLDWEDQVERQ